MARGGGRLEAAARGRRPRGRGALGLLCLAALCGLGAAEAEFSILEEAQVLATQMRKLATEELGVVTMQVRPGRLSPLPPAWIALPPLSGFCPSFLFSFPPSSSSPPPFPHLPPPRFFPSLQTFPPFVPARRCVPPSRCPRGTKSSASLSPPPGHPAPSPARRWGRRGALEKEPSLANAALKAPSRKGDEQRGSLPKWPLISSEPAPFCHLEAAACRAVRAAPCCLVSSMLRRRECE